MNFEEYYKENVRMIEDAMEEVLARKERQPRAFAQAKLTEAMRYSLFAGGKRMRPVFLLEFCRACGGDVRIALPFACAIEMIHTYSLIHDDLPCMDDDDLRRGRPTSHRVYGEATALLAGDALLNLAFETMFGGDAKTGIAAQRVVAAARVIADASGAFGMIGGQILDMENEGAAIDLLRIELTYGLKTGAIITAACEAGCILAGANEKQRKASVDYAQAIGLAFQIIDDILNCTGSERDIGKPVGSDAIRKKMTYVEAVGLDACEIRVAELTQTAINALSAYERNEFLSWFSEYLSVRRN